MTNDGWQLAQFGWSVLQALMTLALWIYAWTATRASARQGELEALRAEHERRLRATELEIAALREHLEHLPTAEDISGLSASIAGLTEKVRGSVDTVDRIDRRTNRIEDFLSSERGRRL